MEMEVEVVLPAAGFFNFGSPCSSYYLTAPSTPHTPSSFSISAPTSPSHASNFYRHDDIPVGSPSAVPFRWEEKPGIPKSTGEDFEFDFGGHLLNKASLSADELFDGGKIKPLKPPPGFQLNDFSTKSNMSSPRSPHNSKLSPRNKSDIDDDPFEAALIKETRSHSSNQFRPQQRGRDKISYISSNFARKGTRSLSPFRMSDTVLDEDDNSLPAPATATPTIKAKSSSLLSALSFSKGSRKWRLRDLLFRSASEGRATEKADQLRATYEAMSKKLDDDAKNSSFRSADSGGSSRRGPASGREMQYTAENRAISEELKKKSFLPYKQGLLGRCLRFNRQGVQEISRGIGPLTRG